jgi:hypothetical protein
MTAVTAACIAAAAGICEDDPVPLSEDEQRILRQIEEHLQRDPGFTGTLHTQRRGSRRQLLLGGAGAVVCLLATVLLLGTSPVVAFVAFLGALACALVAERQARILGGEGIAQLQDSVREKFGRPQG